MIVHRYWAGGSAAPFPVLMPDTLEWAPHTLPPAIAKARSRILDETPCPDPRHDANVTRLLLLHAFGGVWLDYDLPPEVCDRAVRAVAPFTGRHSDGSVCNSAMGFPPGHEALTHALSQIRLVGGGAGYLSGSAFLTRVWKRSGVARLRGLSACPNAAVKQLDTTVPVVG